MITSKQFIDGPPASKKSRCRYCELGDKKSKTMSSRGGFIGITPEKNRAAYFHQVQMQESGIIYNLLCEEKIKKNGRKK